MCIFLKVTHPKMNNTSTISNNHRHVAESVNVNVVYIRYPRHSCVFLVHSYEAKIVIKFCCKTRITNISVNYCKFYGITVNVIIFREILYLRLKKDNSTNRQALQVEVEIGSGCCQSSNQICWLLPDSTETDLSSS